MPTEAPATKPRKTTWIDWLPEGTPEPDGLLTRDQLVDQLRGEGFVVDRDDLRNWQSTGAIPYGINRWRDGAVRTLYPAWMLDVVRTLRAEQANGRKLAEIRAHLRDVFDRRSADAATLRAAATTTVEKFPAVPPDLGDRLAAFSRDAERATGGRIVRAEVRLIDEDGRPLVFRFDVRAQSDA